MKCGWGKIGRDCRGPPIMLAKGLTDKWIPICARCRQKRVNTGNSFMEYKGLEPSGVNAPMGTTREPVVREPQGNAGESSGHQL